MCSCRGITGGASITDTRNRSEYVLLCKAEFTGDIVKYTLIRPLYKAKSATIPFKEGDLVNSFSSKSNSKITPYDKVILFYAKFMGDIVMDTSLPVNDGKVRDSGKDITLEEAIKKLTQ